MLHLVNQSDYMKATFGDSKYAKTVSSTSAMAHRGKRTPTPAGSRRGETSRRPRRSSKRRATTAGRFVLLQATNIPYMNNSAQVLSQELRQAGLNVKVEVDGLVGRRAKTRQPQPSGPGRLDIFLTSSGGSGIGNPILLAAHAATATRLGSAGPPMRSRRNCATNGRWPRRWTAQGDRQAVAGERLEFRSAALLGQWVQPAACAATSAGSAVAEIIRGGTSKRPEDGSGAASAALPRR